MSGKRTGADPMTALEIDVDAGARIVIGGDRGIVPVVQIHDAGRTMMIRPVMVPDRGASRRESRHQDDPYQAGSDRKTLAFHDDIPYMAGSVPMSFSLNAPAELALNGAERLYREYLIGARSQAAQPELPSTGFEKRAENVRLSERSDG
jgi:hypothetical protein